MLWTTWQLGDIYAFQIALEKIAWNKPKGDFLLPTTPNIEHNFRELRLEAIDDLLEPIKSTIEGPMAGDTVLWRPRFIRCNIHAAPTSDCNVAIVDSMVQSLLSMGLWPLSRAENWNGSASALERMVNTHLSSKSTCSSEQMYGGDEGVNWDPENRPCLHLRAGQEKDFRLRQDMLGLNWEESW